MTNDDVLGDGISDEQQMEMQRYICCALETVRHEVNLIVFTGLVL